MVWGVPYCTQSSLLHVMSNYLPLLDELCCRTALFIKSCLEADIPIVSTVARYGIYYGRMKFHVGRDAFFCCSCYAVTDILSVTGIIVSHNADAHISTQLSVSALLLLELLFVREGVFNCSLLSSHDIDDLIDFICIS